MEILKYSRVNILFSVCSLSLLLLLFSSVGPKIFSYVTKVILQSLQLLHVLLKMETQSHILMQVLIHKYRCTFCVVEPNLVGT